MSVVGIIVAFIAGGVFGVIIMALLQANGCEDNIVEGGDKDVEQGNCNGSHNEGPRA